MVEIIGRSSSLFTRVARMFAEELGIAYELVPIFDMTIVEPSTYADNPALKLPTLREGGRVVFGTENICRTLADGTTRRIVWPEELRGDLSRNAQEMVWHAMSAFVQLVVGTMIGKLPADNIYFVKARTGFEGALRWLDANVGDALDALPAKRDLSLFEVTLFCLVDSLRFRAAVPIEPHRALIAFADAYGTRPSAQATPYRFDRVTPPGA